MRTLLLAALVALSACASAPAQHASGKPPPVARPPVTQPEPPRGEWGAITLARTPCFGFCPSYEVTIAANGAVTYTGQAYTRVPGVQHGQADPAELAALRAHILAANFFSLRDSYRNDRITDLPSYRVTATIGGRTKSIDDYAGPSVGMPQAVREIQDEIDRVSGTQQWVPGGAPNREATPTPTPAPAPR